jgi:hypothetical protein
VKIGARIVRHGRSIVFQMAEVMVPIFTSRSRSVVIRHSAGLPAHIPVKSGSGSMLVQVAGTSDGQPVDIAHGIVVLSAFAMMQAVQRPKPQHSTA